MNARSKSTTRTATPAWWTQAIDLGLQDLYALGLDGTPGAELFAGGQVLASWTKALWPEKAWDRARDEPRIARGFGKLMATTDDSTSIFPQ